MKISELILKLEEIKNQHGDLLCTSQEDGYGGKAIYLLSDNISRDELYFEEVLYNENGKSNIDVLKQVFPDFTGDFNDIKAVEKYSQKLSEQMIQTIIFKHSNIIYST